MQPKNSHTTRRRFLKAACSLMAALPAAQRLDAAPVKKVVFVGDRATHRYAEHECNAGSLLMARWLREAFPGLQTEVSGHGWPKSPDAIRGASSIVLFTNGGKEHPAAPHLEALGREISRGAGLVVMHYGLDIGKEVGGPQFLDWIGGYYETHWSVNPMWTAHFKEIPRHPVTRGVKPFSIHDEWYYHMRFRPNTEGVTPLLSAVPPDSTRERPFGPHSGNETVRSRKGMTEHVAWAYERPGGGRGFGFTGGHNNFVWWNDDYRRIVLNGIAWTAGLEIPAEGVPSRTPTYEELLENLDDKPVPEGFNKEKAAALIRPR